MNGLDSYVGIVYRGETNTKREPELSPSSEEERSINDWGAILAHRAYSSVPYNYESPFALPR